MNDDSINHVSFIYFSICILYLLKCTILIVVNLALGIAAIKRVSANCQIIFRISSHTYSLFQLKSE